MREIELPGRFGEHLRAIALGDKPYPNAEGERHHYVPALLLRRFRAPRSKAIFQLDKTDGNCVETTPKNAAWETRLYSVESVNGERDGLIEALFALAENYAAQALDALLRDPGQLTDRDRADLAFFIAIQEQRGPRFLNDLTARIAEAGTMWTAVEMANAKGSKKKRQLGKDAYDALVEGRIEMSPSRELVLSMVLEQLAQIAFLVMDLPWTLFRSTAGAFVCSDRPLTRHDPAPPHEWSGAAWLSSPLVETTMPLSPEACLRISPADRERLAVRNTSRQAARVNLRTYGWATQYVYGSSASVLEDLHAFALAHPKDVPAPSPQRSVVLEDLSTADPQVAASNVARGWPATVTVRQPDGSFRVMSYEVIDSVEDARRAVAPGRPRPGIR